MEQQERYTFLIDKETQSTRIDSVLSLLLSERFQKAMLLRSLFPSRRNWLSKLKIFHLILCMRMMMCLL